MRLTCQSNDSKWTAMSSSWLTQEQIWELFIQLTANYLGADSTCWTSIIQYQESAEA